MKLFIFVGILQVLKFEFLKFRILEILDFYQCGQGKSLNCFILLGMFGQYVYKVILIS